MTLSEIVGIDGEEGNFDVEILKHPRYVDMEKCIACGTCFEKCPKKVDDEYNEELIKRKAIYVPYQQAVPLKYVIDRETCIYFKKGKCRACEKFCPTDAVNFEDKEEKVTLHVGSVILAPGCQVFEPSSYDTYGYQKSPNVLTSLEFERILSATGPTSGHVLRPSDQKEPKKIAWIQCVGSRDVHPGFQSYCSGVCCTYAIKEAIIAKEHQRGQLDTAIFYIDIRTHGKDFEKYYNRAVDAGVRFVKSKIGKITPVDDTENLIIRYTDETGRRVEEEFDMAVLWRLKLINTIMH
jgi:heterodisulfide reductase subunit A